MRPAGTITKTCGTCTHFDKSAWPQNPAFGKCRYPLPELPPLPFWAEVIGGCSHSVPDYRHAYCATWEVKS